MVDFPTAPRRAMQANEFAEAFLAIEAELGLFADRSIGLHWWDVVRYDVYRLAYARVAGMLEPAPPRVTFGRRLAGFVQRLALKARLQLRSLLGDHDVVVLRAPRQWRDGRLSDLALDPIVAVCPGRHLVIDTYPHYFHLGRARGASPPVACPPAVRALADALRERMGLPAIEPALRKLVLDRLAAHASALAGYRRLLGRVRPRLVLLTQNGMEKALFSAAHEVGACVVEAQHGLIGLAHPGYSYPRGVDYRALTTLPDRFLYFSEHWRRSCHYPAREGVIVGNDNFHVAPLPPPAGPGDVMFVAADIYHATLLEWLRPLAARLPGRRFLYKLHPNQQAAADDIRAELAASSNVQVVPGSVSAPSLLPVVSHVVLIQSTFALEALQAGRRVCLLPLLNYQLHRDLFELPGVSIVPTLDRLVEALDLPPGTQAPPVFFDRFDAARTETLLQRLLTEEAPAGAPATRP